MGVSSSVIGRVKALLRDGSINCHDGDGDCYTEIVRRLPGTTLISVREACFELAATDEAELVGPRNHPVSVRLKNRPVRIMSP